MGFRERVLAPSIVVLASAAAAEGGQETANAVTPVVGLCFMGWIVVSALLSARHPSISPIALVCWFLLFFPVSIVFFNGNVEVYLFIWYAYIAVSFLKAWLMRGWLPADTRRFLLEWKGLTFLTVALLAIIVKANMTSYFTELCAYLHGFTTPEFVYAFGVVSCAVFSVTFFTYYLVTRQS